MTRRCITSWVPKAPAKTSMERKTTRIALGRDAVIDGAAPARTGFAWVFADGVGAAIVLSTSNSYRTSGLGAQGPSAQGGRKNRAMGRPLRRPALAPAARYGTVGTCPAFSWASRAALSLLS